MLAGAILELAAGGFLSTAVRLSVELVSNSYTCTYTCTLGLIHDVAKLAPAAAIAAIAAAGD